MALHRDIYWVGRQWAVTGHGMQTVDQKLKGAFDIEAPRLWDEDLLAPMQAQTWFNSEDFGNGLAVARARFPAAPRHAATPEPVVSRPAESAGVELSRPAASVAPPQESAAVGQAKSAPPMFAMQIQGWPAKFVRPWRIGARRK
jgi:hypothetical protein